MNKTYRVTPQSKIKSLVISLPLLFFFIVLFAGPGIIRDPIKWFYHTVFLAGNSIWVGLLVPLIVIVLLAVVVYRSTQYSVIVEPASITINHPFYGFGQMLKGRLYNTIQYANITRAVYVRFPQSIRVYSRTHMTRIIPLSAYEDKEELLEMIKAQLGEKFVVSKKAVDPFLISQIVYLFVMSIFLLSCAVELYGFSFAWTPVLETSTFLSIDVDAYSLDDDGQSVWIYDSGYRSNPSRVWKVTGRNIQQWGNLPADHYDTQISHDGDGNPAVIKENEIIRWQDGAWKSFPFEGEELRFSWRDRPSVQGAKLWGSVSFGGNKNHEIVGLDFVTNQSNLVPMPPEMGGNWLSTVQVNADGSITIEMKIEESKSLYVYKDGKWMEPGYPLEKGTWMFDPIDYCMDAEGNLWILQGFSDGFRVGRYSTGKNGWEWFSLNSVSHGGEEYSALQVDQRGRLWLQGDIDYDDFVRVYEVLPKGLYKIVEYNKYNSNLESDFLIMLGSDGKMWAAGNNIAYIDSNAPILPKPFPDWLATLGTIQAQMVIAGLMIVSATFMVVSQKALSKAK